MPSNSVLALAIARLLEQREDSDTRYFDLEGSWVLPTVAQRAMLDQAPDDIKPEDLGELEVLLTVGGRWDRQERRYVGPAAEAHMFILQPAQAEAARWLARWFRCYQSGDWRGMRRVWSVLFYGGRRGGKTDLALLALVFFSLMVPGARIFAVSPTEEETAELRMALLSMVPPAWATVGSDDVFCFRNGSEIHLKSGYKPQKLKQGRIDFAMYNEAQKMSRDGFVQLRGGTADRGGLVIAPCNPPDRASGQWVEDFREGVATGKRQAEAFFFDPRLNPYIEQESLLALADEVDELTYRREVLGEFVPIGDVVMHAWSDVETIRDVGEDLVDITEEVTRRELGRPFPYIWCLDFQRLPHMAASSYKVFAPPDRSAELLWCIDEAVLENADEDDMVDYLEAKERWTQKGWVEGGYDPKQCAVIADASGDWQDVDRTRGRSSFDWLRARGWRWLYKPDRNSDKNPDIVERVKTANARVKSASGLRRFHSCRHCTRFNKAMRFWENRNGAPSRRGDFAHLGDTGTYAIYRLYGRSKQARQKAAYVSIKKMRRRSDFKGF